jgi:hypothetical protein
MIGAPGNARAVGHAGSAAPGRPKDDNLFRYCILAIKFPITGRMVWYYQVTPANR